jgi:hypothetical protein
MGLRDAEDGVFARWSNGRAKFVRDGAADEASFCATKLQILFLLKEVNSPKPGSERWDLREFMRKGARPQTWNTITRWARGIRMLPNKGRWTDLRVVEDHQRKDVLRSLDAMNLKKSPGGHTTVVSSFWDEVDRDAHFIREQFLLYDADFVVCCGSVVAQAFDRVLKSPDSRPWQTTSRGIGYLEYKAGKFAIAYSHPEARIAENLLHYGLVDAVHELQQVAGYRHQQVGLGTP